MKILVVEDDAGLAQLLAKMLEANHYQVELAADGEAGLSLLEAFDYDLVLLDLLLPKLDGICFCQRVRTMGEDVPILLMTAEDTTASKIAGLDAGADDYVIKPLDIDELLARIRALLRRGRTDTSPVLCWGALSLDPSNCEVFGKGERLHLTSKEYEVLELLLRNPHRIFSLNVLLERLWAYEKMPSDNAVRTHIKSLRRKLKQGGIVDMVETVYGLGYRLGPEPYAEPTVVVADAEVKASLADEAVVPEDKAIQRQDSKVCQTENDTPSSAEDLSLGRLRAIWEKHQQKYLDLIARLEKVVRLLAVPQSERLALLAMHKDEVVRSQQAAHTLKGALGSFGFMQSSRIMADIEKLLLSAAKIDIEQMNQLPVLLQSLRQSLQPNSVGVTVATKPQASLPVVAQLSHRANPVVYQWLIVDRDQALIESLIRQASVWRIQTRIAMTLDEARQALSQHSPAVVMVDPSCGDTREDGLFFLRELAEQRPSLPVIVASELDALNDSPEERLRHRVEVLRSSHNSAFLQKPVAAEQVLETVNQCLTARSLAGAKVLVLDDDPQILECLEQLLAPWGFQLTLLSDPFQFWDALEQVVPDLLILDIEMPDFNGLELCQVIRHDPHLSQLPILFLSAHTEADIVQRVFECGADDYISKPIVGPELVARILNRLERLHLLRKLAETDGLTGLSCRRQSVEQFSRLMRLANRQQATVCLAVLDLDQFKQVNDRYGHDMGDRVLKTFGASLLQWFRDEDVVARWGGEEFVVGLYDTSKKRAVQRLSTCLEQFFQRVFEQGHGDTLQTFQVSFSGGVSAYPADGEDLQQLYQQADKALYRAKAAGRSRIFATGMDAG